MQILGPIRLGSIVEIILCGALEIPTS